MAWSTRQIADLAGTTVNAVRHYHEAGLLEEPERRSNGYKQYGVPHLVRLLQIRRLRELGVPLAEIEAMGRADKDPAEALRVLDAELEATIERLQRARAELALILRDRAPIDLPATFGSVSRHLSEQDRSLVTIYSQLYDESALSDLREMLDENPRTEADDEFDNLPADADAATKQRLAEYFAPQIRQHLDKYPWLTDPGPRSTKGAATLEQTMVAALREVYNLAQLDVLYRADLIIKGMTDDRLEAADEGTDR
ncbi:MerR family transcriptional regulator [Promicromonospora sp. NPDC052451]|uniref:helix-turn-helix domain-containing protein n=1 Tax=Promicromonospora sp. NPDC052451 TaxID=3364407 RepID=UPI0037C67A24